LASYTAFKRKLVKFVHHSIFYSSKNTKYGKNFIIIIAYTFSPLGEMHLKTIHNTFFKDSKNMSTISSDSIDLVVTSSPYPMIEMWDELFENQNPQIKNALTDQQGHLAFELMHQELDKVWNEIFRVLIDGGIACINIGDATRKIGNDFQLYSNHSRILNYCIKLGFQVLPSIIWRKPTNAPNKFMGSGMLPSGAYVTLEHEHILILRKNGIRKFKSAEEKENRRSSAYFWEERNLWFSDVWLDLKGIGQSLGENNSVRKRSAAFPFDLAYRLINMFSVKGDTVLDPFLGTGTTILAAMVAGRNSIGYEINPNFTEIISSRINAGIKLSKEQIDQRLKSHLSFISIRSEGKKDIKYINEYYNFPVITKQETDLTFNKIKTIQQITDFKFVVTYHSEK
jgi:DNA modification methylase